MAQVPMPDLDHLPPGPHRDLLEAIHQLHKEAGWPGLQKTSREIREWDDLHDTISHEGIRKILRGDALPVQWLKLDALVRQYLTWNPARRGRGEVEGEVRRIQELWHRAKTVGEPPDPWQPVVSSVDGSISRVSVDGDSAGIADKAARKPADTLSPTSPPSHTGSTKPPYRWIEPGKLLAGHTGLLNAAAALHPDGSLLATSSEPRSRSLAGDGDTVVRLWNRATGAPVYPSLTIPSWQGPVRHMAFSPNGLLVTSSGKRVELWDSATGTQIYAALEGSGPVAFSPDGHRMVTCFSAWSENDDIPDEHTVRVLDTATGALVDHPLTGLTVPIGTVAFSSIGHVAAGGGWGDTRAGQTLGRLWEPGPGGGYSSYIGMELGGHLGGIRAVAFSPDGQLLATVGEDRTVRVQTTVAPHSHRGRLIGHTAPILNVAFSPDGQLLATAGEDGTVRLWDPATQKPVGQPLCDYTGLVRYLAFTPDSWLIAVTFDQDDSSVRLWQAAATSSPSAG